jgi:hypothetical protein
MGSLSKPAFLAKYREMFNMKQDTFPAFEQDVCDMIDYSGGKLAKAEVVTEDEREFNVKSKDDIAAIREAEAAYRLAKAEREGANAGPSTEAHRRLMRLTAEAPEEKPAKAAKAKPASDEPTNLPAS